MEHAHEKWSLASILLLVSGVTIIGICGYLFLYVHATPSVGNGRLAKNGTIVENYTLDYPIFRMEKVDMLVRNYASRHVYGFLERLGSKKNDPTSYLTVNYRIMRYDAHTVTVAFQKREKVFERPEEVSQDIFTYDLKAQTQLEISDIFKDTTASEVLLRRIFYDFFKHDQPGTLLPVEHERISNATLGDVSEYVLDDDAVIFYVRNILPTPVTISVKKELLAGVLKDMYITPSPSRIPRMVEQPMYTIEIMPRHDEPINPGQKMLALTFDDGPGNLTPRVLDTFRQYGGRGTFFVIGRQVPMYAAVVKRIAAEGHEVGNHSWSHPTLTQLTSSQLEQQIIDTQQAVIQATGGYTPTSVRPPQGVLNTAVAAYFQARNLRVELWNADTLDWLHRDTQRTYASIMSSAADGRVILLHDIHSTSVDAATRAIPQLIAQGYQLVTVSDLHRYR
jgi:peptidoglycan/xylan/chitin deacetylase (PgdA/CDA1 family)